MPNILISGAANGLGAAFLEAYLEGPSNNIIAIDLDRVLSTKIEVKSFEVDVSSQSSVDAFVAQVADIPIHLVIHSAGIRGLVPEVEREHPDEVAACETLEVMNFETLTRAFQINAAGTFMLLRGLLPNLRMASGKVVVMASRMGSIGNNEPSKRAAGSAYAYRASKAALNTIVRSFAVDVPEVSFILCHPGRVETKLVKCKEEGAITAEESVNGLLPLIKAWDSSDSGKFYDRFGETIEW